MNKLGKRKDYINWDEYFMGIALLSGYRSKDPSTPVGACIVDRKTNRILSVGYNGFPIGCSDDDFPWGREGEVLSTKYPYVVHAELNAILNNRSASFEGNKIYTTLFPCNECTKAIIQAGIREIIYLSDKYADTDSVKASKKMLGAAGVKLRQFKSSLEKLTLSFMPEPPRNNEE
ncbi:MAG TPA: dCMP deaminase family protein [Clostridiales bacterium]|jgi:dCMP deaminase|nr:dCMP deaminase family protein [Clostridiales bacterium]